MCSRISCFLFWTISNWHYIPNETRQFVVIKIFRSCWILLVPEPGTAFQTVGCDDEQVTTVQRLAFLLLPGTSSSTSNATPPLPSSLIINSPLPSTSSQPPPRQHDHDHLFTFKIIITSITFNTSTITSSSPSTLP